MGPVEGLLRHFEKSCGNISSGKDVRLQFKARGEAYGYKRLLFVSAGSRSETLRWEAEPRPTMHLAVYRLMQYTLREVICRKYGHEEASSLLRSAGLRAGEEFC